MKHQVYVELDALVDTRLATIAKMGFDPIPFIKAGCQDRLSDEFDAFNGSFPQARFAEEYRRRDVRTLQLAGPTEMLFVLDDLLLAERRKFAMGDPFAGASEVTLNCYPYRLDDSQRMIYAEALAEALHLPLEAVTAVSIPYAEMNEFWLRSIKPSMMIVYNYAQWLTEAFGSYDSHADPIGSSTSVVLAPKLLRQRSDLLVLSKIDDPNLPTKDPFIMETRMRAKMFSLDFKPIQTFSLVKFQMERTSMNPILKACYHVNEVAGKVPGQEVDWAKARQQYELQRSELAEMEKAIANQDLYKYRDGIADMIMVTVGHGAVNPIPVEEDFLTMAEALMSRIDDNEQDALLTMDKYYNLGLTREDIGFQEIQVNGKSYFPVRTKRVCTDNLGEEYAQNKFLKSHLFVEPVYAPLTGSEPVEAEAD